MRVAESMKHNQSFENSVEILENVLRVSRVWVTPSFLSPFVGRSMRIRGRHALSPIVHYYLGKASFSDEMRQ